MKETAERLEGASDESQEKLTSAFEIAGSLRKLLEDRDNQFATLEGTSRVNTTPQFFPHLELLVLGISHCVQYRSLFKSSRSI